MPPGRLVEYTDEIAAKIIARLVGGESLRSICRDQDMPARSTVHVWVANSKKGDDRYNGFADRYHTALEIRAYELFDELFEIADDSRNDYIEREGAEVYSPEAVQRSRLRVDVRKWALSKMMPKTFGDKLEVDNRSTDGSMTPKPGLDVSQLSTSALAEIMKVADESGQGDS